MGRSWCQPSDEEAHRPCLTHCIFYEFWVTSAQGTGWKNALLAGRRRDTVKISICSVRQSPMASGSLLITDWGQWTTCIPLVLQVKAMYPSHWQGKGSRYTGRADQRKHIKHRLKWDIQGNSWFTQNRGESFGGEIFSWGESGAKWQLSTPLLFRGMFQGQGTYWQSMQSSRSHDGYFPNSILTIFGVD